MSHRTRDPATPNAPPCRDGVLRFSSLAGAKKPGCRAGLLRSSYAQNSAGHAGQAPAAPAAWRIQRPAPVAARPDAAWADPEAARRSTGGQERRAAPAGLRVPPPRGGRDPPRPSVATATPGVFPGGRLGAFRRAGHGSHSAPASAVHRSAASAARGSAYVRPVAE